jgi:beta-xylosidase
VAHTFEDLVKLERLAEEAHAAYTANPGDDTRAAWRDAADAFLAAVVEHAAAEGVSRYEMEMAAKRAVRHPETEAA